MRSLVAIVISAAFLVGCTALSELDRGLYEATPAHPVTGKPIANLVSEDHEIGQANRLWAALQKEAAAQAVVIDPPGDRLDQIRRVFAALVAVAHRQHLPWDIHFLDDETVNAMTPGGGMVFIFSGIFTDYPHGQGFLAPVDDEIAAVLAHEIAHVTLLHVPKRMTSGLFTERDERDAYYGAAYSTEQEAEADRLSVLYMALAGFAPSASARVWQRAHQKYGSDPDLFLYDHPLNVERMAANEAAAAQVAHYYSTGRQNPDWHEILDDNPLFPRASARDYAPGQGLAGATSATLEAMTAHEQAKAEASQRETKARATQANSVRLLATKAGYGANGDPVIQMQFHNGSAFEVKHLGLTVLYGGGGRWLAQDPACGGPATILPGQTVWLACPARVVPGATQYNVQLRSVEFR